MNEQEFIYGKLKYLTESVEFLLSAMEKQQDVIEQLTDIVDRMQSPEYAKKQSDVARNFDAEEKIKLMRAVMNNKK